MTFGFLTGMTKWPHSLRLIKQEADLMEKTMTPVVDLLSL